LKQREIPHRANQGKEWGTDIAKNGKPIPVLRWQSRCHSINSSDWLIQVQSVTKPSALLWIAISPNFALEAGLDLANKERGFNDHFP
jgi:hypothetical protein